MLSLGQSKEFAFDVSSKLSNKKTNLPPCISIFNSNEIVAGSLNAKKALPYTGFREGNMDGASDSSSGTHSTTPGVTSTGISVLKSQSAKQL
mmetsp:Transcript_33609/g.69920  ORF Transcript_33609/g.69920 Transcript_33609/m.69920 type:complete len:92 (+) Transcript_33609:224-499(+)